MDHRRYCDGMTRQENRKRIRQAAENVAPGLAAALDAIELREVAAEMALQVLELWPLVAVLTMTEDETHGKTIHR
jgi:hypothetical protein